MNTATRPYQGILGMLTNRPEVTVGKATFYGPIKPQGRSPAKYAILVHKTGQMLELEANEFSFRPDKEIQPLTAQLAAKDAEIERLREQRDALVAAVKHHCGCHPNDVLDALGAVEAIIQSIAAEKEAE